MSELRPENIDRIIKKYDIRGKYPVDLNEEVAYWLGRAVVQVICGSQEARGARPRIIIGADARLSSPELVRGLSRGIVEDGGEVHDLGQCSTDMVSFAVGSDPEADAAVMVTASHNPKDENGMKISRRGAQPASEEDLKHMVEWIKRMLQTPEPVAINRKQAYAAKAIAVSGIRQRSVHRMKVVVEAGNGMGGVMFQEVARQLPYLDVVYSNLEPDGNFPVILPNPIKPEFMRRLQERVLAERADIGIGFDGDADRAGIVDERGEAITASEIVSIITERLLRGDRPDRMIMYNLCTSRLVLDTIRRCRGVPWMTPVGHGLIKARMRQHPECLFAGEHSGHYFFRDFFCADTGMTAALAMIEATLEAAEQGRSLHDKVLEWRRKYLYCIETNFDVRLPNRSITEADGRRLMQEAVTRLRNEYARSGKVITHFAPGDPIEPSKGVDTLRIEFETDDYDWWFCVRPSDNEPLLRLIVEVVLKEGRITLEEGIQVKERLHRRLSEIIGLDYLEKR